MASKMPKHADLDLPLDALQLLAPPVRLVSAALWKVLKQRDVMQYGVVEEFVTSVCESVPGMLTVRHQGKLALGLRGRLILELCRTQPDPKVVELHLNRIRAPVPPPHAAAVVRNDVKIAKTVESFHLFIHTLLTDPTERKAFFKEDFPRDYGPKFDEELEKLLWEFLIRMDQLLPVPNLAQTVSWLSDAPSVLQECARSSTQPQLLNILLQHQSCLGHLEPAASLPPNMGDSILTSLSLPPSGRTAGNKTPPRHGGVPQTTDRTGFLSPVIGTISYKGGPVVNPAGKRSLGSSSGDARAHAQEKQNISDEDEEEQDNLSKRTRRMKRKRPNGELSESDDDDDEEEEEEQDSGLTRCVKRRTRREDAKTGTPKDERLNGAATQLSRLPEDPYLCSIVEACLSAQPSVVVRKLPAASVLAGGKPVNEEERGKHTPSRASTQRTSSNRAEKILVDISGLDDKENLPVSLSASASLSQQRTDPGSSAASERGDDYVADSEDEATKNFKGRLFRKRYYRTKHGTYVPTLREYWRPGLQRRHPLSVGTKPK